MLEQPGATTWWSYYSSVVRLRNGSYACQYGAGLFDHRRDHHKWSGPPGLGPPNGSDLAVPTHQNFAVFDL